MAGETIKTSAVCLRIHPWSRTSHVVQWLTPAGKCTTVVRGAERAKSFFLGQYDLNYTCEIVRYRNGRNDVCPLRECAPLARRDALRDDFRALLLADRFRFLAGELAPAGPDARGWFDLLDGALDSLVAMPRETDAYLRRLLAFEIDALTLAGLAPAVQCENGSFALRGERRLPVPPDTARLLRAPYASAGTATIRDALRVLGVFGAFHLDLPQEPRRGTIALLTCASPA